MSRFTHRTSPRHRARGLSLIEVMVSVTITTMLLLAVGTAYSASASAVKMNDDFFRSSQAARVSLGQMLTEIRRCDSVAVTTTRLDVIRPDQNRLPNEVYRSFSYDATGKKLTLKVYYANGTSSPTYTLASNVTAVSFGPAETGTDANNATIVLRVPVTITVKNGTNDVQMSGSAGPRRVQQF